MTDKHMTDVCVTVCVRFVYQRLYIKDCKQCLKSIQIIKLLQFDWVMFEWLAKTIMNIFYKNLEPHLKKKFAHHFFSTNSNPANSIIYVIK
jgi:hypothetical protein